MVNTQFSWEIRKSPMKTRKFPGFATFAPALVPWARCTPAGFTQRSVGCAILWENDGENYGKMMDNEYAERFKAMIRFGAQVSDYPLAIQLYT